MATTISGETESTTSGESGTNGHAKVVVRSEEPYPYHSVQEAFRVAEAVQKAGGNSAAVSEVLKVLGLTSATARSWTYRLSTAREFGLVEKGGRGDDAKIQVTDLFMAYTHPTSDAEKRATLMQIVLKPALYGKLLARYKGAPKPDATGLANLLWREHGILPTVKEQAAEAFLASIEFAGLITNGVVTAQSSNGHSASPAASAQSIAIAESVAATPAPPTSPAPSQQIQPAGSEGWIEYVFPLRKAVTVKLTLPPTLTKRDIERLTRCIANLPTEDEDEEFGGK